MVYSVLSVLRRSSTSIVFTSDPVVSIEKRSKTVRHFKEGFEWKNDVNVKLLELKKSGCPQTSAVGLCKFENNLFKKFQLSGKIYTIFLGPEEYTNGKRITRIGIAMGLHHS